MLVEAAEDRITRKLAGLHAYQLAIPAPRPHRTPFNFAAQRGEALFNGKAKCAACHVRLCIPSRDGTATRRRMFASIVFKPTVRRIGFTGQGHWQDYSRIRRAAFIMMAVS